MQIETYRKETLMMKHYTNRKLRRNSPAIPKDKNQRDQYIFQPWQF